MDLQKRLDAHGVDVSWPTLMRDLGQVHAVRLEADGPMFCGPTFKVRPIRRFGRPEFDRRPR
jgi:arginine repressor